MKIKELLEQGKYILKSDPACKSLFEAIFLYPVNKALFRHDIAHYFYKKDHTTIARWISQGTRKKTGIEIHPGAKIGKFLFIDHGMGVVIGETAEIGDYVTMYHGVTLGGTGNEKEVKRHPTIGNHVILGARSTLLGPIKIGDYAKIGAGAVVLDSVGAYETAVGMRAEVVRKNKKKLTSLM